MSAAMITTLIWLALIFGSILYELWTVLDSDPATLPLTDVYLRLMNRWWFRVMVFGFFSWMTWHWIIQPFGPWEGSNVIDFIFIAGGMLFGALIGPPKRGGS
jgi:hypothetical protein